MLGKHRTGPRATTSAGTARLWLLSQSLSALVGMPCKARHACLAARHALSMALVLVGGVIFFYAVTQH